METRNADIDSGRGDTVQRMPWAANRKDGYYFVADPLVIDAAPEAVWDLVKSVDQYEAFSDGVVSASLPQDELKVGNTIHLVLYKNNCIGKFIPESDEKISVLDNERYVVAWERALPGGGTTECYRMLEPLDDGHKTRSHIALKIPGFAGFFTHALLKKKIEAAFNAVNAGIKHEAEKERFTP